MSYSVSACVKDKSGVWTSIAPDAELNLVGASVVELFEHTLGFTINREDGVLWLEMSPFEVVNECKYAIGSASIDDYYKLRRLSQLMTLGVIGLTSQFPDVKLIVS